MRTLQDLRPAQARTAAELRSSAGVVAVLGMGAGKTAAALTAIADLRASGSIRAAVVAAPKTVATDTWPKEIAQWAHLQGLRMAVLSGSPAQRRKLLGQPFDVYAIGIDNLIWLVDELEGRDHPGLDQLVIDELSKLRDARGKRAKALLKAAGRFKAIWGLTGTPRPEGEEDLWMQLQIISGGTAWRQPFDEWRRSRFMPMDYQGYTWKCHDFAKREVLSVFNQWAFRVPPDAETDIPFTAGDEQDTFVDLCDAAERDARTLDKELLVELGLDGATLKVDELDDDTYFALNKAVATGKLTQVLQGFLYGSDGNVLQTYRPVKQAALVDLLDRVGGEPTLIAYHFKEDLAAIREAVPGLRVLADGGERTKARLIDEWNDGQVQRMALHPASAGHGLNLQHGGRRIVWYHPTWSKELYAQTVKRLARPGQRLPVFSHRIRARHWLEDLRVNRVEHGLMEQQDWIENVRTI